MYNGYGSANELVVFGHVFGLSPLPRKRYRKNIWTNSLAMLRLFMVRTIPQAPLQLRFNGEVIDGSSEADGFFRFQWKPAVMPPPGWHGIEVTLLNGRSFLGGRGLICIPFKHQYAVISDIDDTFLISHSSNLRKRLYVLFTKNAYSRKPFEGVVKHYQALSFAGAPVPEVNPFFYVSSSEWNLYDFIVDFTRKNELPPGIFLLNQVKFLSEVWKTGQNRHATKFMRISRVLEAFPDHKFILLGDDSQQDPVIYTSVVQHFSGQISAVYLRNVFPKNAELVKKAIAEIEAAGVACCHFSHSREALAHSASIGLIGEK